MGMGISMFRAKYTSTITSIINYITLFITECTPHLLQFMIRYSDTFIHKCYIILDIFVYQIYKNVNPYPRSPCLRVGGPPPNNKFSTPTTLFPPPFNILRNVSKSPPPF